MRAAFPFQSCARPATPKRRGTKVHFLPDRTIFTVTEYNYDTLAQRLRELAFLNKGLEITLTDERTTDPKTGQAKTTDIQIRRRHRRIHQAHQSWQAGAPR